MKEINYRLDEDPDLMIEAMNGAPGQFQFIEAFSQGIVPGIVVRLTRRDNHFEFIRLTDEGTHQLIWELERALRGGE